MQGMTLKQMAIHRFFVLLDEYRKAKKNIGTPQGNSAFVLLSVQLHSAKGQVPKRYWPLVNRDA